MVITEFYLQRDDGVNLYRTYSDRNMMILQEQTGIEYSEAVDVENSGYTYKETDNPVDTAEDISGSYDERHDVLYVCKQDKGYSYGTDDNNGLVTFRSMETDEVTGIIVYDFLKKFTSNEIDISALPFDVHDFVDDFIKKI